MRYPALTFEKRSLITLVAGAAWLMATVAGLVLLFSYENRPGTVEQISSQWPKGTRLALGDRTPTLVMFAHPRCPCTRASLGELEKIIARCHGAVKPYVVFFKPNGATGNWDHTDLWKTATSIPGVEVMQDADGQEARRFHATTSGQTVLYDRSGKLVFNGGITLARGHSGDNPGRDIIESYLRDGSVPLEQTPVFGCPIVKTTAPQ